ncbi:MAG: ribosomal-protein-alanine acetyltransferase [Clostridiales bacterium]|jgi:hypothetical protein|nr:ribosomal-protein-alanine acetyltransferase [Clostridiales bacterium]
MRRYAKKLTVKNAKVIDEILCNMCGQIVTSQKLGTENSKDYISISKKWGYFSQKDGQTHRIDICEECYDKLVKQFAIPPSIKEYFLNKMG